MIPRVEFTSALEPGDEIRVDLRLLHHFIVLLVQSIG